MRKKQEIVLVADEFTLFKTANLALNANGISETIRAMPKAYLNMGLFLFSKHRDYKHYSSTLEKNCLKDIQSAIGITTEISLVRFEHANTIVLGMGEMPRNGCLYISHLMQENTFVPFVEYDKHLAREKNNVFMELAAALGAKSIYLEEANFYNSKGKLVTDFSLLKPIAMDIGINARFEKDGSVQKEVYSTFDAPKNAPRVPAHLQNWVDIDSDLRLMATHRLEHGLLSHKITLNFVDTLNGAAEVAAKITGVNKSVGFKSSYSKSISSSWVFEVQYHPVKGY